MVKKYTDYLDQIKERYPDVDEKVLKYILLLGIRRFSNFCNSDNNINTLNNKQDGFCLNDMPRKYIKAELEGLSYRKKFAKKLHRLLCLSGKAHMSKRRYAIINKYSYRNLLYGTRRRAKTKVYSDAIVATLSKNPDDLVVEIFNRTVIIPYQQPYMKYMFYVNHIPDHKIVFDEGLLDFRLFIENNDMFINYKKLYNI